MSEQAQHEAALQAASTLLAKKSSLQVWHIPDWVGDYCEQSDEPDDFDMVSFFHSQARLLKKRLESPATFKEMEYSEDSVFELFEYVGKANQYDPEGYNPKNFPWYKTDDPNVKQSY